MRTRFSESFAREFLSSLEKVGTSEGAILAWETRKRETVDVFVAGLRNFKGSFDDVVSEYEKNPIIIRLYKDVTGKAGQSLAEGLKEKMPVGEAVVREKHKALGAWYEKDEETGEKKPVSEPSVHMVVEGNESEIVRQAVMVGREFGQQSVVIATHDPDGEGRVFSLSLDETVVGRKEMEAVLQHVLDSGLGGATGELDPPPSFRFLAMDAAEAGVVRKSVEGLPKGFGGKLQETSARVQFIPSEEYDDVIAGKAAEAEEKVVADVFLGGVRRRGIRK